MAAFCWHGCCPVLVSGTELLPVDLDCLNILGLTFLALTCLYSLVSVYAIDSSHFQPPWIMQDFTELLWSAVALLLLHSCLVFQMLHLQEQGREHIDGNETNHPGLHQPWVTIPLILWRRKSCCVGKHKCSLLGRSVWQ